MVKMTLKDVPRLIEKCRETGNQKMVFAVRAKRSEGRVFTLFYSLYKGLFKLLTGQSIHVGNFSLVPRRILHRLVHVSEIWNHYAVGVIKSKIPTVEILANRGRRMAGESRMNFVSLVVHGLSAICCLFCLSKSYSVCCWTGGSSSYSAPGRISD